MRNKKSKIRKSDNLIIWSIVLIVAIIVLVVILKDKNDKYTPSNNQNVVINLSPKEEVSVGVGYSTYLFAMVEGVPDANISWKSSDDNIATVYNGTVIGVKEGKVVITASYVTDKKEYKVTKDVLVIKGNPTVSLKDVGFSKGELYMPVNSQYQLNLILTPSNAHIDNKEFTSSDSSVIDVTNSGLVKAIREGHSSVTVKVNNKFEKTIDVYVGNYNKPEIIVSPDSISFNSNILVIKVGSVHKLKYVTKPDNISYSNLIWTSSNPNIVSVNDGIIKGIKEGSAVISLSSLNGKRDDITIEVKPDIVDIEDIILSKDTIDMEAGNVEIIIPKIMPNNVTNKVLGFTSSDSSIVSVSLNSGSSSATLSALHEGTATITITGGSIEKKVNVNVINNNKEQNKKEVNTTIKVRGDKNNISSNYEEVKNMGIVGTSLVTVSLGDGVSRVQYCLNKIDAKTLCIPNINIYSQEMIPIPSGNIFVLRIKKYDFNNNEITSTSKNYIDGALTFYINTKSKEENVKLKQYEITGAYFNTTYSKAYPLNLGESANIKLTDNTRHLLVCYTTDSICTPNIKVTDSYKMTLNKTGIWRIFVMEYDLNNQKLGNTETYYAYVKNSENSNYSISNKVKASKLSVNSNSSIGKYLSVFVESETKFSEVRFCYKVVDKGSNDSCDLNTSTSNVILHRGGDYFYPKEALKTYYGKISSINSKTLYFDLDELDNLSKKSDTTKDVILSLSIGSIINNKMTYSNTIRVRINMTKKTNNGSYWNTEFVKEQKQNL